MPSAGLSPPWHLLRQRLATRKGVGIAGLEPVDELRVLVPQGPHDVEVVLAPGHDAPVAVLGPADDVLDAVVEREVARHEAREHLVDHVLLDEWAGAPAAAVDAEEDGRLVLPALEVDVQRAERLGRGRAA